MSSHETGQRRTNKLRSRLSEDTLPSDEDLTYAPVSAADDTADSGERPVWRVRFDVVSSDPVESIGLDVNRDAVLGRGKSSPDMIELNSFGALEKGVSRRHAMLRPTATNLFIIDLGSTNGTLLNGRAIGVNTPYHLSNGDLISVGSLKLVIKIINRPKGHAAALRGKADLAETLIALGEAIASQPKLDDVLRQVLEMAKAFTSAGETAVWLIDEATGELVLEAEQGIEDEEIRRMRLPVADTLAGQVLKTGKPLRASRDTEGHPIKVKTGYLVDALLYVPLTLGGVTFGVLAAAHREPNKSFDIQHEQILLAIGNFAAIAVQNSRLYEATDRALAKRVEELDALAELSREVSESLDTEKIHDVLMVRLRKSWSVQASGLWLIDDSENVLKPFVEAKDPGDDIVQETFKMGEGLVGKVAQSGQPMTAREVKMRTQPAQADDEPTVSLVARSAACVPLRIEGQVIGVLALFSKQKNAFTEDDLKRLQSFADPVATAIWNARLFARSERERATVHATANVLSQPLMIVNDEGDLLLSNQAADELLQTVHQSAKHSSLHTTKAGPIVQLLDGLGQGVGRTAELTVGDETYVATVDHASDVGAIIVMQDVTEIRRVERLRTEFAQAISHDIRGPLASIRGYAQMLKDARTSPKEGAEFLDEILGASDRLIEMANQLLDFALLSEPPQTDPSPCNLDDIVTNAVRDLKGAALAKDIDLDLEIENTPYQIQGNATRLYRALVNLIDNAIKYSPEHTQISVRLTFGQKEILIRVRDAGPGIPDSDLPLVFERYYRSEEAPERTSGIGLGLAMVKTTIVGHGGEVVVRNVEAGPGTEFIITFPAGLRVDPSP